LPLEQRTQPAAANCSGRRYRPPTLGIHFEWQQRPTTASVQAAITAADGPVQRVVPPEGIRGKTRQGKTGFHCIALQANVPIVLAFMDYERKLSGLEPEFNPTGDVERDMAEIERFYAPFKGKRAEDFEAG